MFYVNSLNKLDRFVCRVISSEKNEGCNRPSFCCINKFVRSLIITLRFLLERSFIVNEF